MATKPTRKSTPSERNRLANMKPANMSDVEKDTVFMLAMNMLAARHQRGRPIAQRSRDEVVDDAEEPLPLADEPLDYMRYRLRSAVQEVTGLSRCGG